MTIRVRHEIVGLDKLSDALRELAQAKKYEARVRGGFVRPKVKDANTDPPEWVVWSRENAHLDEVEIDHLRWAYDVLRGAERVPAEKRVEAMVLYQKAQEAGYGLPDLDGREMASRNGHAKGDE